MASRQPDFLLGRLPLDSQALLKRAVLAAVALGLALMVLAAKFDHLDTNSADYAQLARNLLRHHAFTTSALTPLSLAVSPRVEQQPELNRPPLYVTVLALAMLIGGESDRVVGVTSLVFLLLTALALYWITVRSFGWTVALWTTFFYFSFVPVLRQGLSGLDTTFLSFLVTLLFGVLLWTHDASVPPEEDEAAEAEEVARPVGWSAPFITGVLVGLCYLTAYDSLVLLPVVLLFWWKLDHPRRWRHAATVLLPFLVLVLPWTVRSSLIAGRPFISLHGYEILMNTEAYPGQTLYRRFVDVPHWPWLVAVMQAPDVLKKVAHGVGALYLDLFQVINPGLMAFFVVGTLLATIRRERALIHGCLVLALVLQFAILCLYQPLFRLLLPYSPMLTALAVWWLVSLAREWAAARPDLAYGARRMGLELSGVAIALAAVIVTIPLILFLFMSPAPGRPGVVDTLQALGAEKYAYLGTDVPWLAAWYSDKRTLALPAMDRDWDALQTRGLLPAALYLSPSLLEVSPAEGMRGWQRLFLARGEFRDLRPVSTWRYPGLLLAKGTGERLPPGTGGSPETGRGEREGFRGGG